MKTIVFILLFFSFVLLYNFSSAQNPNCDSLVPTYNIDFTGLNCGTTWTSPWIVRNGFCCGAISPDRCVDFIVTTDSCTIGIVLSYCSYVPNPGSALYKVDCGPLVEMGPYGDTAFISSSGIHYVTFCKPGNISVIYCLISINDTLQIPTGINENEIVSLLTQDLSGNNFLYMNLFSATSFTVNIFSAEGKIVSEKKYDLAEGEHNIPLPTQELAKGIYFCHISGQNISKTIKFIK